MKKIVQATLFKGSVEQVFAGISDYGLYPRFVTGVHATTFVDQVDPGASCGVRYDLKLIKSFYYILDMYHSDLDSIAWQMRSSNLLSHNAGSWTFEAQGESITKAIYELDIGFKIFVPNRITKKLTETSLPLMFKGVQDLIDHRISVQAKTDSSTDCT